MIWVLNKEPRANNCIAKVKLCVHFSVCLPNGTTSENDPTCRGVKL